MNILNNVIFVLIGILLLLLKKTHLKNKNLFKIIRSRISLFIVVLLFFIGGTYFFQENNQVIICNKSSLKCLYYSSTLHSPDLSLQKEFDISDIQGAMLKMHKTHSKHGSRKSYKIFLFSRQQKGFELPVKYVSRYECENDVKKLEYFFMNPQKEDVNISRTISKEVQFATIKFLIIIVLFSFILVSFKLQLGSDSQKQAIARQGPRKKIKKNLKSKRDEFEGFEDRDGSI